MFDYYKLRPKLKEYHTRAQRRMFRENLKNVASVLPSVANLIYQELALDSSAAVHPVTQERLSLIFLGQNDLIPDLRTTHLMFSFKRRRKDHSSG